jgi:hypothetical protein
MSLLKNSVFLTGLVGSEWRIPGTARDDDPV